MSFNLFVAAEHEIMPLRNHPALADGSRFNDSGLRLTQPGRRVADGVSMSSTTTVAAPHNWCDRRCERCPLAATCPVPGFPDREPAEILLDAVALLETMCRDQGIDPSRPPPPESPDARLLREAGRDWAVAFAALDPAVADTRIPSVVVAGKLARIAAGEEHREELWSYDTVPNLLVVERLLATARCDVDRSRAVAPSKALARFDDADSRLNAMLSPLLEAIAERDRAAFAALAAAGRAPSPLATR